MFVTHKESQLQVHIRWFFVEWLLQEREGKFRTISCMTVQPVVPVPFDVVIRTNGLNTHQFSMSQMLDSIHFLDVQDNILYSR